jgi:tRNA-dihydrouridine synthase B
MTLTIGTLTFSSNLIQAPLAGYSCAPMRKLAHSWGGVAYSCTEMLSSLHIYSGARQKRRFIYKDPSEGLVCFQLSGNNADVLTHCCHRVQEWGADLIDLNCGCPQPKIRKKGVGSKLLADPEHLYGLLKAMKQAASVPVTVKIRVDNHSRESYNDEVADAVAASGVDALIVHGRHWSERYDVDANFDEIKRMVLRLSIPVIANGDVDSVASAKAILAHTGAAGLMVARASVGQPWLFQEIASSQKNIPFQRPSFQHIGAMLLAHVKELIQLDGEVPALLQSRKLFRYYARKPFDEAIQTQVNQMRSLADLERLVGVVFD